MVFLVGYSPFLGAQAAADENALDECSEPFLVVPKLPNSFHGLPRQQQWLNGIVDPWLYEQYPYLRPSPSESDWSTSMAPTSRFHCQLMAIMLTEQLSMQWLQQDQIETLCQDIAAQPICNALGPQLRESICEACPCGAGPASDAVWLAEHQEVLAISPQARLVASNEAGDLRFLGIIWSTGLNTLCLARSAGEVLGGVNGAPPTIIKHLSEEQAELNIRTYDYAAKYNESLIDLICSGGTPVLEARRREPDINCTK